MRHCRRLIVLTGSKPRSRIGDLVAVLADAENEEPEEQEDDHADPDAERDEGVVEVDVRKVCAQGQVGRGR